MPDERKAAARQGGTWTEHEKAVGAPQQGDAGPAGEPDPKAHPTDDRAATEAAAAKQMQDEQHRQKAVGGGRGPNTQGGSAAVPPKGSPTPS
ncbi:MAG TPA: hypothetical protein VE684_22670 [Crenalkalicoccus sp.]|jgi:hypothetical protein|nr:hypothetical protein [Crenalkalicoccus sp.]